MVNHVIIFVRKKKLTELTFTPSPVVCFVFSFAPNIFSTIGATSSGLFKK